MGVSLASEFGCGVMTKQKLAAIAALPALLRVFRRCACARIAGERTDGSAAGVRDIAINPPPGAVVKSQGRFYILGRRARAEAAGDGPERQRHPNADSGPDQATALNPSTAPTPK